MFQEGSRGFQEGSRIKGIRRFKKALDGSKRIKKVQAGSRRLNEGSRIKGSIECTRRMKNA